MVYHVKVQGFVYLIQPPWPPPHTDFPLNAYLQRKNVIPGEELFKIQVETSIGQWHVPISALSFSASEIKRRCPQEAQEDSYNDPVHVRRVFRLSSRICPLKHKWRQDKSICHHREPSTFRAPSTTSIRLPPLKLSHMIYWGPSPMGHGRLKTKEARPLDRLILIK